MNQTGVSAQQTRHSPARGGASTAMILVPEACFSRRIGVNGGVAGGITRPTMAYAAVGFIAMAGCLGGGPPGIRTLYLRIKSPLLCR